MSKSKVIIILALVFVFGVCGGIFIGKIFSPPDKAAENQIIIKHYDEFGCGDGEENIPQEYKVANVTFADDFKLWPDGELNVYEYQPLAAAAELNDILNDYFAISLAASEKIRYDGYNNYRYPLTDEAPALNSASYQLSSNYYTGKFSFNSSRSADEIKSFVEKYAYYDLFKEHKAMQSAAENFAEKFTSITGKLTLDHEEVVDMVESIYDDSGLTEYVYQGYKFYFVSDYSTVNLNLAESIDCPILSGSQEKNYFIVTVCPDCTVKFADNNLTMASVVQTGQKPALTKEYLQKISFLFTSFSENDTLVYDEIKEYRYSNYFGYTLIEPHITIKYHYASDPKNIMETSFVYNLTWVE